MNDTSDGDKTQSVPPPTGDKEILVGSVNTTFEPLKPEDLAPKVPEKPPSEQKQEAPAAPAAEEPATEDETPPPLETAPSSPSQDKQILGCLLDVLLVLVSVVLGAFFALILLLALNGTLFLNDSDEISALKVSHDIMQSRQEKLEKQVADHDAAIATAQAQIEDANTHLQELDKDIQALQETQQQQSSEIAALQARADEIEQAAETVRQDVADAQERLDDVEGQVADVNETVADVQDDMQAMQDDIEDVKKTAARFDRFVKGLIALISEIAPEELGATAAMTATPPLATPLASSETPAAATLAPPETPVTPTAVATQPPPTPSEEEPPDALQLFPPLIPLPTPAPGRSVIYGLIWLDNNGNGAPDADENPLAGVQVVLQDAGGDPLLSMNTGDDGRFSFIDIPPGRYRLLITPAAAQSLAAPEPQSVTAGADESMEINIGLTQH